MEMMRIEGEFTEWRSAARSLLIAGVLPGDVIWSDQGNDQSELFEGRSKNISRISERSANQSPYTISKSFLELAETVACHRDETKWGFLYRILWRLTRGNERHLLAIASDSDVVRLQTMAKEVRRDIHKMRAFVRFWKIENNEGCQREQFVAWFEPSHLIVKANAQFFRKRFTGMDWSILTPDDCVHWDGATLHFTDGLPAAERPQEDQLETLWKSYYRSIFNPARLKLKAMQAEMPVKYWKNLPEAPLIHELTSFASRRVTEMVARSPLPPSQAPRNLYLADLDRQNQVAKVAEAAPNDSTESPPLSIVNERALCCRACPLWERATRTVVGEGNPNAEIMILGEQPGEEEDLVGRPFSGPAGKLLDEALSRAGLAREDLYLTNTVKHFKWKPGNKGKRRLHEKANSQEIKACRPWLLAEIRNVLPSVILTLGNTAAQAVIHPGFRILKERGEYRGLNSIDFPGRIVASVHPSYLLRLPDPATREREMVRFVQELLFVREAAKASSKRESNP